MENPDFTYERQDAAIANAVTGAAAGSTGVMLLTSFHHIYGAVIYQTPWRYHAVYVALASAVFIGITLYVFFRRRTSALGRVARWLALAAILLLPVCLFGLFEGAYNHLLKNALYFGGASLTLMRRLFPPPTYELPNDVLFEATGILQVLPALAAAYYAYRLFGINMSESGARKNRLSHERTQ